THVRYTNRDPAFLNQHIRAQLAWVRRKFPIDQYVLVKIFTSGSFLDTEEVPGETQREIVRSFWGKVVMVETRPEYVATDWVRILRDEADDGTWETPLHLAMGLETTNDFIRKKCIRKGSTCSDFMQAAARAHEAGVGVKTYLLMKPPFLTENEAIDDMITSVKEAGKWSDQISMNLCTVQSSTPVEWLWRNGEYRPSYLWSVLTVLAAARRHIVCDPIGGGTPRGPHNCGVCDRKITDGIRDYSLSGDRSLVEALLRVDCRCKEEWQYVRQHEMPYTIPLSH
ncbi:MAG: archaeosine biosynthesis radical SAM protein RaSEA, partial [Methanomicrobiales archaeon]|nr:archaeosine biosynthesis radical SAM protein RaSEA [Methanomicrobiales archaeon]